MTLPADYTRCLGNGPVGSYDATFGSTAPGCSAPRRSPPFSPTSRSPTLAPATSTALPPRYAAIPLLERTMITLAAHIAHCQALIVKHPAAADFPIIYAVDDEGNDFHKIGNHAALAEVDDLAERSLTVDAVTDLDEIPTPVPDSFNAVIIN